MHSLDAPLTSQYPLTLRVQVVFLRFFVVIVNENEFSCKILSRYIKPEIKKKLIMSFAKPET